MSRRLLASLAPIAAAAVLVAGCSSAASPAASTVASATASAVASAAASPTAAPHWTYEGEEGPSHWGELAGYETCGTGKAQSPIDITGTVSKDLKNIALTYGVTDGTIFNNGHTIQTNFPTGASIVLDGATYNLLQIHYHTPSEHTENGKPYPIEYHFVHKSAEGKLAVLGVFVKEGAANAAWDSIIKALPEAPKTSDATKGAAVTGIDLAKLLPTDQTTVRYTGSLTTPPCTEGVNWNVFTTPITMSAEQIAVFEKLFENNNRPVQPVNGRELDQDSTPNQ